MERCRKCGRDISSNATRCRYCYEKHIPNLKNEFIITTAGYLPGYEIIEHNRFVYGEIVCPNGFLGAITNGTFSTVSALADARCRAVTEVEESARRNGANAIIGLDVDISDLNGQGVLVSANGTAVFAIPEDYQNEMQKAIETKKEEMEKRQREETAFQEKMGDLLGGAELTPMEEMLIKFIAKEGEASTLTIKKVMPRSCSPADIQDALVSLETKSIIKLNESGSYSLCN